MKRFRYNLDEFQLKYLFQAFRGKPGVMSFWMRAVKTVITYSAPPADMVRGLLEIHIDKMQRVFVQQGHKAFSASFPFSVKEIDGLVSFSMRSGIDVDSKLSSEAIAFLDTTSAFQNTDLLGFADDIFYNSDDPDNLWRMISELICADDGYVRLDHDPERVNGNIHPLNHIDVFYSQGATFKIGLNDKIVMEDLSDILNVRSDCHFLIRQ